MPEGILRVRRRLVFGSVILEELIRRLLDRFPLLFAGFLFDDLAVTPLQSLALATFLCDGLWLIRGAGGAAVPPPVQIEFVMVEPTVLEDAHSVELNLDPIQVSGCSYSQVVSRRGRPRVRLAGLLGTAEPPPRNNLTRSEEH